MCLIYVNYVSWIGVIFLAKPVLISMSIKAPHTVIFSAAGVNLPSALYPLTNPCIGLFLSKPIMLAGKFFWKSFSSNHGDSC